MWYKSKLLKKIFLNTTDWNVAWKKNGDLDFKIIQNPKKYWLADSLVFSDDSGIYLFVEAFDKEENIGKIAVLEFDGNNFVNFRIVMERPYHLSYPYVFKYSHNYYMVPETSNNNFIELYKATKFPDNWEKVCNLLEGKYVDTTLRISDDQIDFYSYNMNAKEEIYCTLNMENYAVTILKRIYDPDYTLRGGGNVYYEDGSYYRMVQNNKYFYGQSLKKLNFDTHEIVGELLPNDIKLECNKVIRRIHTFSKSNNFVAIDVSDYKFDFFKLLKKIFKKGE